MAGILVVDDDASIRETVRFLLEEEGYSVDEAPHGLAALEMLCEASAPYVVLLDLMMPILDGYAVLRALRAGDERLTRHSYIVLSAHGGSLPTQADELGIGRDIPFIAKPFELAHLLDGVNEATDRLDLCAGRMPPNGLSAHSLAEED